MAEPRTEQSHLPHIHDLAQLLSLVEQAGQALPGQVKAAAALSDYAVGARYPGPSDPVTQQDYEEALTMAAAVVDWAQQVIAPQPPG